MKKKLRKLLIMCGVTISFLLILLIISSLIFYYNKSLIKGFLEKYLEDKSGTKLEIGLLNYDLFPLSVQANSVKVFQKTGGIEIDIFLSQLSLKGEVRRLLRKQKPIFRSIEITAAACRIFMEEAEEEMEIDYQKNMLLVSNMLSYVDRVNFKDLSFKYITSSNRVNFERGSFFLSGSDKKGEFDYSLSGEKVEIRNVDRKISLESTLSSSGKFSLLDPPYLEGEILFERLYFAQIENKILLPEMFLRLKGEFQLDEKKVLFPQFEINVPAFIDASGYLKVDWGKEFSLVTLPKVYLKNLNKTYDLLKPYLRHYLSPQLKTLDVEGAAYLEGEYQYSKDSSGKKTSVKGQVKLEPTQINCLTPGFSFSNSISGEIKLKGSLPDVGLSGSLKIKNGNFSKDDLKIQDFSLDLSLEGTKTFLDASPFKGSLKGLTFSSEEKNIDLEKVEFSGQGNYDINGERVNLIHLEFQVPLFPPFQIRSKIDLKPQGERYFHLKSPKIDTASLLTLFSSFMPEEISELEPAGQFDLEMEVSQSPQDGDEWSFSSTLNLSEGAFHNPSFTLAGESLHQKIALEGKYHPLKKRMKFSAELDISRGESLWNEYYVDWSKNPFRASVSGVFDIPLKRLSGLSIEASLTHLGRINARGLLGFQEPRLFDLQIHASQLSLSSLYSLISQEQTPEQSALDLEGEAESQIQFKKEKNKLSIIGQIRIRNGSIKNKEKELLMEGIEVEIPLFYENQIKNNNEKEESFLKKGYFTARNFKTPYFSVAPFQVNFRAGENKFMIEPLTVQIFGGRATLGKSVFSIGSKPSEINGILSFSLSDLDLSQIPLESDKFNLDGAAQVDLSYVEINPEQISTKGKGIVDIFDTRIIVENIKITKPFSENRTVSCDVRFKDLNLEKLTDSIPFGRVTGILRGEIKNLGFSYGQPESFIMTLESVKREGVPQKFSLGAVNDLSIISSGEGTSLSSKKGFTRFVREFGYQKIGIFCSLENDIFTLRGTIKEKEVEYLVKRSWLFGISVVNKKPRNRIRFKDMVDRLKRIGRTSEPGDQT